MAAQYLLQIYVIQSICHSELLSYQIAPIPKEQENWAPEAATFAISNHKLFDDNFLSLSRRKNEFHSDWWRPLVSDNS